ncbi:MAG: SGNH/GDSL hydrolase family protein [Chthoniobacter sp.]|nr:SGNH/GDSL hydrolase family protein [Chthoniobacter sp.]
MKRILASSLATLLATSAVFAETKPAAPAPAAAAPAAAPAAPAADLKPFLDAIDLKDGDTLVFLGDSITHQCLYTQYIEDFFYTRYPKLHIHFHNSGVGGDRAKDAITRFDEDVAAYKPKYVTILLGMNDGSYRDYDKAIFDTYQQDMTTVLDKIAGIGATAIPMTPTMFDSRSKSMKGDNAEPRKTYYNGVLALYGAWLHEQAQNRGLGYVDMFSPLNNLTIAARKKTPNFTMIPDGVHPAPTGQVVMATAILEDIVPRSQCTQITVDEKAGKLAATASGGKVTDFNGTADSVSFTFAADRLPWVLPPDAVDGYKLTHAGHHYSNEKVSVRGLKAGKYTMKIDGETIGTYASGQLAFGVELEENDKTPEYQQALKVALLNQQRNNVAYHPLRDQYSQLKGKRRDLAKIDEKDPQYAAKKAEFETWYTGQKAKVAELLAQAKGFEDQIYQANQPVPHKYEFAPAPEEPAKSAKK